MKQPASQPQQSQSPQEQRADKAVLIQKHVRRWLCQKRYNALLADKFIQVLSFDCF